MCQPGSTNTTSAVTTTSTNSTHPVTVETTRSQDKDTIRIRPYQPSDTKAIQDCVQQAFETLLSPFFATFLKTPAIELKDITVHDWASRNTIFVNHHTATLYA